MPGADIPFTNSLGGGPADAPQLPLVARSESVASSWYVAAKNEWLVSSSCSSNKSSGAAPALQVR